MIKTTKQPLLLLITFASASSLLAQNVIYDGSSFSKAFGNASGTQVTGGSPNSAVDSAAELTFGGGFGTIGWEATSGFIPDDIDWSVGDLTFDYKTTSPDADVFMMRIFHLFTPLDDIPVATAEGVTGLNTDGNWHTFTWDINDWDDEFQELIDDGDVDPSSELSNVRVFLQSGTNGSTITVDNVTVPVPEPTATAAVIGFLALGTVLYRRRRQ